VAGSFVAKYGPWALVTGASRGVGAEFARQLAAKGLNLVLVATNTELLCERALELEQDYGIQTRVVTLDLACEDVVEQLAPLVEDVEIGLLVSNAAISTVAPFLRLSPEYLVRQLHVNSRAGLMLVRFFAPRMVTSGRGGIILMSSGSAQHGTPLSANYSGTKAFNLMLAEALWYELRPSGVDVLGVMLGATHSDGWDGNNPQPDPLVPVGDAAPAVAEALRALGRRPSVATGRMNRLGYAVMSIVSRGRAVKMLGSSMYKMFRTSTIPEKE